jgi:integrase
LIHVEHGKGGRDRYAMLSPRLLGVLRAYWRRARPGLWLFPGQEPGTPVSTGALQAGACVTKRKISGGTMSEAGRNARDVMLGLMKTCRKLGVSFSRADIFASSAKAI